MKTATLGLVVLTWVVPASTLSCGAPSGGTGTPAPSAAPSASASASAPKNPAVAASGTSTSPSTIPPLVPPAPPVPPAVDRACTRDDQCAVARIEVSGAQACCAACVFTPGTRRWHADLQLYCGAHASNDCSPLACPEGPTRAVCRAGVCEASGSGADGGPVRVPVEQRCLPAMFCDAWAGCAEVVGNDQDGWFVQEAERGSRGELASIEKNVCSAPPQRCEAARLHPTDVVCAPQTAPPLISPPGYSCAVENGHCRSVPAR